MSVLCSTVNVCAADATGFSGYATLTSQYIYRGLAYSNGDPAVQLSGDYQHHSGIIAGAWASTIDLQGNGTQRDLEFDYYLGYRTALNPDWTADLTAVRYSYPRATGSHSYDYTEVLLGATWRDRYSVELGFTSNLYGLDLVGRHWELRGEWPVANTWVIGAGIGGNDLSGLGVSHFAHWDLGASARLSRFTFDLRWFDNQQPDYLSISNLSAGSQIVVSVSVGF